MVFGRRGIFGKKPPISEEALKDAYARVSRVRTILDASSVADAGALMWAAYALKDKMGVNTLPEWHDLSANLQRYLEFAYYLDVLDDSELAREKQKLSDDERNLMEQLHPFRGSTAEGLFRELGLYSFDPADLDEIAMPDILSWLQTSAPRDPAIWHELPLLNWDDGKIHRILRWVVEQPECDAATAIDILHLMSPDTGMDIAAGGTRWLFGQKDLDPETSDEIQMLKTICLRSEDDSFTGPLFRQNSDDSATGNLSLLDMMKRVLATIEADGRRVPFPMPEKLLSGPVPQTFPTTRRKAIAHDIKLLVARP